jgi:DNA-binding transcriptional LysR family regulator
MSDIDLNLLVALDALLAEGSVAGAARKLGLSASAMSRTLARLRAATDDPLLVRAGRSLVPTPRAADLRERVPSLTQEVRALLQPAAKELDLAVLERSFTLRANEAFVQVFAARLVAAVTRAAPGVRLRFAPKPDKDVRPLREGSVDLEIGVLGQTGPEVRVQALFTDHFVGAVRQGHPLLAGDVTAERFAACGHVIVSPPAHTTDPVDEALAALGLARDVVVVAPSFPAALAIACASDLVAQVTETCLSAEQTRQGTSSRAAAQGFELPVQTAAFAISQMWHPRMDADPAHRWLRGLVHSVCRKNNGGFPSD